MYSSKVLSSGFRLFICLGISLTRTYRIESFLGLADTQRGLPKSSTVKNGGYSDCLVSSYNSCLLSGD